ncbi:MAG: YIP1 family protein [Bacteroidetes bacterium]|nr:YIP1 family protein [Bacteroidota bacterium]
MDNFTDPSTIPSQGGEVQPEPELSHSDKMIGIFSEPSNTYERISQYPTKTIDWFLPVLLMLVVVFITQLLLMSNKEISYQMKQKQLDRMEKRFNEMVAKGQMTQDQANDSLNRVQDQFDKGNTPIGMVLRAVGILIFGFVFFFIISGIYFLFAKFVLRGDGNYSSVLVASGLTSYIGIIQIILAAILALILGKPLLDTSIAAFLDSDRSTYLGFILAKLDVFSIWSYIILSIGLAKMFKSKSMGKYYIAVFGIWIIGGLLLFLLGKAVPFLGMLGG